MRAQGSIKLRNQMDMVSSATHPFSDTLSSSNPTHGKIRVSRANSI